MLTWDQSRDRFRRAGVFVWRHLVPDRWSWPQLVVGPSTYLLLIAALLTTLGKASAAGRIADGGGYGGLGWATGPDIAFYFAIATLFAAGEARSRWMYLITVPLSALCLVVSIFAAGYLYLAGEQLSYEALIYGFESLSALGSLLVDQFVHGGKFWLIGLLAALIVLPIWTDAALTRIKVSRRDRHGAFGRARLTGCLALIGLCQIALFSPPSSLPRQRLGGNAVWRLYSGWINAEPQSADAVTEALAGYDPIGLVATADTLALRNKTRPNVVLIVIESGRYDHFALSGSPTPSNTPNITALAKRGTVVPTTRAVLPHTTKSLFSMMCARLPIMHRTPGEVSALMKVQCLGDVFDMAGYRTAFFQSALGSFEHRPRLVDKLGFAEFSAWEDLQGQPLGYLGSDDRSLAIPFGHWMGKKKDPFFAILLTSSTHHPYRLTSQASRDAAKLGKPMNTDAERYARLIEQQDELVGDVVDLLEKRGRLDSTIIVVLGDHGEGFGDKGILQHDNNFFEEGLRVPFVMAGPNIPPGHTIPGNATVLDLAPTLLGRLGVPVAPHISAEKLAFDLFEAPLAGLMRPFGCYYASRCRGFVKDSLKVVMMPEKGSAFALDLATDPNEQRARPLSNQERELAAQLDALIGPFVVDVPMILEPTREYGAWKCPVDQPCRHPKSPAAGFFQAP